MVKVLIYIYTLFNLSTPVLIRHLWQLKTVVFLHWCVIHAVLLENCYATQWYHLAWRLTIIQAYPKVGTGYNLQLWSQSLGLSCWIAQIKAHRCTGYRLVPLARISLVSNSQIFYVYLTGCALVAPWQNTQLILLKSKVRILPLPPGADKVTR